MAQNLLSNDIANPTLPGQLVWSGYVQPGASAVTLTLPVGLYSLVAQGSSTTSSFMTAPNSWGRLSQLRGNFWIRAEETSVQFSPQWRQINLYSYMKVTQTLSANLTNFIYDGTYYGVCSAAGDASVPFGTATYYYSTNLISWSSRSISASTTFMGYIDPRFYCDSQVFIYDSTGPSAKYFLNAGGSTANTIAYSTDSITWSLTKPPGTIDSFVAMNIIANPAATNRYVCIINTTGTKTQLATSTDGITWTSRTYPDTATAPVNITTNKTASTNQIYAIGDLSTSNGVKTSTDGVTWTSRTPSLTGGGRVIWFADKYWLIPTVDSRYSNSTDGVTWTAGLWPSRSLIPQAQTYPVVNNGKLIMQTASGVFASTDGVTWDCMGTAVSSPRTISSANNKIIMFSDGTSTGNIFVNDEGQYMRLYRLDNQVVTK